MSSVPPPSSRSGVVAASTTVSSAASAGNRSPSTSTASTLTSAREPESQGCLQQLWTSIASLVSSLWNAVMGLFCCAPVSAPAPQTIPQSAPPAVLPRQIESIASRAETYINETVLDSLRFGFQACPYKAALLIQLDGQLLSVQAQTFIDESSRTMAARLTRDALAELRRIEPHIHADSTLKISVILSRDVSGGAKDTLERSQSFHGRGNQSMSTSDITNWEDPSGIPETLIASYTGTGIINRLEYDALTRFFMGNDSGPLYLQTDFS